jgi:hypothetical protein
MPVAHDTVIFDVHDAQVAPMLSDTVGALPTYGSWVDVPGAAEVGFDPNFVTAELKGDARVMAKKGRIDRVNLSITFGMLSLDVLSTIYGTQTTDVAEVAVAPITGDTVSASVTVTGTGYTSALVGRRITGTGISADTMVAAVTGGTSLTLSKPATATGSSVALTVAAQGSRANSRLMSPAPLPYFKYAFKIEDLTEGIGDLHVVAYKCQVTGGTPLGSSTDNFGQPTFDAEGIALAGNLVSADGSGFDTGVMLDINLYEDVTAITSLI